MKRLQTVCRSVPPRLEVGSPLILFESHNAACCNPCDVRHPVWITASENYRVRRINPFLQHRERATPRQFRRDRLRFTRRYAEDIAKHVICAADAEVRIAAVSRSRATHRRNVHEVKRVRRFDREQLPVVASSS